MKTSMSTTARTSIFTLLSIVSLLVFSAQAHGNQIRCYSNANAPAYRNSNGLWILEAKVASDFRLQDVKLKNQRHKKLESESKSISYDRRINEFRIFKLSADTFCNYDIQVPRDFSKQKSFQAELTMTCDDMFDAEAKMTCVQR